MERGLVYWEEEQQLCGIAETILQLFLDNRLNVQNSLKTLKKVQYTIEEAIQSTRCGEPLTYGTVPCDSGVWDRDELIAEATRRKNS